MTQLRWVFSLTALTLFFTACSTPGDVGGVETVTVTLTADPAQVAPEGGEVTLTATVDGEAAAVDFVEVDAATTLFTDDTPDDGFSAVVTVTPPRTYVALAKNAEGATIGTSSEVIVTAIGTSPEPTPPLPEPGPVPPTPEPTPPDPGGPIPDDAIQVTSAQEVNAAPAGATIVITQDIICADAAIDPCITLKDDQRLLGAADGQLLTTPGVNITTSIPTNETSKIVAVRMANGTVIEGINFDGEDMYQAISAPAEITEDVTIRNVSVSTPTFNNVIDMKSTGALTLENLTFTSARAVILEGFSSATLTGLDLTINRPPEALGSAFTIVSGQPTSTLLVDALNLTTNLGGSGRDAVLVQSGVLATDAVTMNTTISNSSVTFAEGADLANSIAFNFNVVGTSGMTIDEAASIGNTTNSTYVFKATYDVGVTGRITLP
jgi:hypothetical protein